MAGCVRPSAEAAPVTLPLRMVWRKALSARGVGGRAMFVQILLAT
jgi:hypothetical protein